MLRYAIVALAIAFLVPLAFADSTDPSRDANLALVNEACLVVDIHSANSAISADSSAAAKSAILSALADKTLLYGIPIKAHCTVAEVRSLPMLFLVFTVVGPALLSELEILLPGGTSGYAYPSVWSLQELYSTPGGVTPKDIREQAPALFDNFALTWKKEHTK